MGYNGPSSKTKVCRYYLGRANNHFGKSCSYVHPCRNILISGSCKHGRRCTDDHVCRDYVFYGDSGPHGCKAGDACRLIHVKQDVDRAALIDMYRDWIAVKQHEAIAAQTLGSASAAASVVQTEIMMAAAVTTPAAPAGRVSCPFWYTDTMAGCKAGPDCVYEHAGQFQLPTRPLPTPAQTKFAERAWEKRRAQEAAATPTTLTLQPGGTPRSMVGSGASDSSSPFSLQPASGSLAMDNSDQSSHGPSVLSLGDGHGPVAAQQGSLLAPKAALAADFSNLLNPSPVITQALQMASIMSGPPTPAPMSHTASTSSAGRSPRMPHHSPGNSMGMGATGPMMATGQAHMPGKRRTTPPKRNLDAVPAPGTLGADLLLPSPGAASAIGPRPALSSSLGLMGMDMSNMGEGGVHSLQNALAGLTM